MNVNSICISLFLSLFSVPEICLAADADGRGVYGYNWWTNGIKPNGKRKWPSAPPGTYSASGYNNNDMFVIPEWNMVIVRLGLDQNEFIITDEIYSNFLQKIGRSISNITDIDN